MPSTIESCGNAIESSIASACYFVGGFVGHAPRKTIILCIILAAASVFGFLTWEEEGRREKLFVPQDTTAEMEEEVYDNYFPGTSRLNRLVVENRGGGNVLVKDNLIEVMKLHEMIRDKVITVADSDAIHEEGDDNKYDLFEVCARAGGSCVSNNDGVCQCLMSSIFRQWDYDLDTLENDDDILATLANYGSTDDLAAVLGNPTFDADGNIVSAEALSVNYFLQDRSYDKNAKIIDPINEAWEKNVFLDLADDAASDAAGIRILYFATRSFADEFGDAIEGDLALIQVSYIIAFLFLGANMGKIMCSMGSRWTMALAAVMTVVLSTLAGFGFSSIFGLFYGPIHNLLPFVVLGIGVDDAFVIVNAFDRERRTPRTSETNEDLAKRTARALGRAGASITVTSLTDLVAFAISTSSALPALASFCGYASVTIFFLWFFASTFFTACLVLDERRQRDNRRECICCLTRGSDAKEMDDDGTYQEDLIALYFRKYHAPAILSPIGKVVVGILFTGLLGYGIYGALNLSVEDSQRNFIPRGSYLNNYFDANDKYFPSQGIEADLLFEGSSDIYASRVELANLESRLSGLSNDPPYIAEPVSDEVYKNVMDGLSSYLADAGTADALVESVELGSDNWPTTEDDFVAVLKAYVSISGPGAFYAQDISLSDDGSLRAYKVGIEYVRLTKSFNGETIEDAAKQIDAMDETRKMISQWDDLPPVTAYSSSFINIESFKVIQREFFVNIGLAVLAVAVIILLTVPSPRTAMIITFNVAICIIEILGFVYTLGVVIDSVSVINVVLAVGLSVDYSAHIGHCFMLKPGDDKNKRATDALTDIGTAVLNGAISTFLAVAVLLFAQSYVFEVLSRQFMVTVLLGSAHGLILLPVMLSVFGPQPFASAAEHGNPDAADGAGSGKETSNIKTDNKIAATAHNDAGLESSAGSAGEA